MKNFSLKNICFLTAIVFLFSASVNRVFISRKNVKAQTETLYYRVIDYQTPFYADENGYNLLFYLPYSYYIKVISEGTTLIHAECFGKNNTPAIDGYVPKENLQQVDYEVVSPFLDLTISTCGSAVLYKDAQCETQLQLIFSNRYLGYYGNYVSLNGENLFFVYYGGKAGYIKESDVTPFDFPLHIRPVEIPSQEIIEDKEETQQTNDLKYLKIAVITCLMLAGFFALFVAFRKKEHPQTAASYFDEEDFE